MSAPHVVLNIASRYIDRVEFLVPGCNRNGCLVGTDDDGDEHRSMRCGVLRNLILTES